MSGSAVDLGVSIDDGDAEAIEHTLKAISEGLEDFNWLFERRRVVIADLEAF